MGDGEGTQKRVHSTPIVREQESRSPSAVQIEGGQK
jgi:hypothetical protein